MSRHRLKPRPGNKNVEVWVGWDRPLATFFAQVLSDHADAEYVWVGVTTREITDPQRVIRLVAPYAEIPDNLYATLLTDSINEGTRPCVRRPNHPARPARPSTSYGINNLITWIGTDRGRRLTGPDTIDLIPDVELGPPRDLVGLVSRMDDCRHQFAEAHHAGRPREARFWHTLTITYRGAIADWLHARSGPYSVGRWGRDEIPF
ncbi:hypothetical protein [Polymorphospora sp. NPDC050346]|uniref:hypothetical protein n=1 Tax=Polymorphospora sp. NPDC050346 TaxID=3155780 RepID=UPI0033ED36DC